jgi:hypothetical protein
MASTTFIVPERPVVTEQEAAAPTMVVTLAGALGMAGLQCRRRDKLR